MTIPWVRFWAVGARCVATAALACALIACSPPAAATGTAPSEAPVSQSSVVTEPPATSVTTTQKPTASPRTPAPAELQGRWRTVINDADKPVLTISDFKYTIERLGMGTGSVEVTGDEVRFFGSNLCAGDGLYTWSITGEVLTLTSVAPDPCANRADAIRGRPFERME